MQEVSFCSCVKGADEYTPDRIEGCEIHDELLRPVKRYNMKETIEVDLKEFGEILAERDHLCEQVQDLQTGSTALVQLKREDDIAYQVAEFHLKFGFPVRTTPAVPAPSEVKLRLCLLVEEFFETLMACTENTARLSVARDVTAGIVRDMDCEDVDLPEFVDGLADLDYIVQGTRAQFGVPRADVAREVHRANMSKEKSEGDVYPDIKPKKPAGWKAPDIEGVLRKAGWKG